ncbi:MAG: UDP-N-acetylmuramoyl-L-alanyl-D-glutamate--2,6-diaminopimelate ligase [Clostridia bacterium]|nr:UDP-N-acetylmuramoyl-L-alanyl-D-glutamate--2,6-diaminopimelate ligase [Clostridia bacterium]
MKLAELFKGIPIPAPAPDLEVSFLTENSSKANARTVFVCIEGAVHDGHGYAPDAYARGCRVFVTQKEVSLPSDAFLVQVEDTRHTLASLACHLYENPSHRMHLIGITGTKGKTTTAQLIAHVLNQNGIPCGYVGTNGISYANTHIPTKNTTPDAVTLQETLCEMLAAGVFTAVLEVSSQALMQYRVDGIRFSTVLFTNLSFDHIGQNEHPSWEHYKACKHRLFTDFEAETVIYNAEDPAAREMLDATSAKRLISCSIASTTADVFTTDITLLRNEEMLGIEFHTTIRKETVPCSLAMIGKVNAENALLTLAVACEVFAIPLKNAAKSLKSAAVAGRSECVQLPFGACAIIDYAHNETSLRQLLTTLREYRPQRLIALFGSVGERSQLRRREMGRVAAALCDLAILTSDNPGNEPPEAIIEEIAEAFAESSTPFLKITDRAEAIRKAISLLQADDILVLAGKGHENYQLIGTQKIPFSEKALILETLKEETVIS